MKEVRDGALQNVALVPHSLLCAFICIVIPLYGRLALLFIKLKLKCSCNLLLLKELRPNSIIALHFGSQKSVFFILSPSPSFPKCMSLFLHL